MTVLLQMSHHPQINGVPQVQVRRSAIDAVLDPQGPSTRQLGEELSLANDRVDVPAEGFQDLKRIGRLLG